MVVTLYLDSDRELERSLPWGLRLALVKGRELRLVVARAGADEDKGSKEEGDEPGESVLLPIDPDAELGTALRSVLDRQLGAEAWELVQPKDEPEGEEVESTEDPAEDSPSRIELLEVGRGAPPSAWLTPEKGSTECLVAVQLGDSGDEEAAAWRRELYDGVDCELVVMRAGTGTSDDEDEAAPARSGILLTTADGPNARAAARWASELEAAEHGPLHALHVQQDIGPDSQGVGQRRLRERLRQHLEEHSGRARPVVRVEEHRHVGIAAECEAMRAELVLLGASKRGELARRLRGTVARKVMRSAPEATIAIVRAAVPLSGRTERWLARWFQRRVPQLERESRLALADRVQSSSHWDFDFVVLMSLSTLIAAAGLVVDSAAVIIGAMLVAPLMTPIMGVGMALVQGNPPLLRLAFRSVGLGFLTSYLLSVVLGLLQPGLEVATAEMAARHLPGGLDLFVAFVAGLAGVYSSSRPNLTAALPGVAIAAALVPPIATAGVASSIGNWSLALGATALFVANFVAIVLASALGFWAVGLREGQTGSRVTRVSGIAIGVAALGLALALSLSPARRRTSRAAPPRLRERVEALVGDGRRLQLLELAGKGRLVLELAGEAPPDEPLLRAIEGAAAEELGAPVELVVRSVWERRLRAPESIRP